MVANKPFAKAVGRRICFSRFRTKAFKLCPESHYTDPIKGADFQVLPSFLHQSPKNANKPTPPRDRSGEAILGFVHKEVKPSSTSIAGQRGRQAEFPPAFKTLPQTSVAIPLYLFRLQRSTTLSGLSKHLLPRCPRLGQKTRSRVHHKPGVTRTHGRVRGEPPVLC